MKWKIQVCSIATFRNDHQDALAEENINANWNIKEMYANGPLVKEYVQIDTHGWTILMEINFFVIFTYLKHSAEIQGFFYHFDFYVNLILSNLELRKMSFWLLCWPWFLILANFSLCKNFFK